jgi:hypothetical protein
MPAIPCAPPPPGSVLVRDGEVDHGGGEAGQGADSGDNAGKEFHLCLSHRWVSVRTAVRADTTQAEVTNGRWSVR